MEGERKVGGINKERVESRRKMQKAGELKTGGITKRARSGRKQAERGRYGEGQGQTKKAEHTPKIINKKLTHKTKTGDKEQTENNWHNLGTSENNSKARKTKLN